MRERPILFSGPMVRAILDGRKTVTRRVLKPQPDLDGGPPLATGWFHPETADGGPGPHTFGVYGVDWHVRCPYGAPNDWLWVQEAHAISLFGCAHVYYRADNAARAYDLGTEALNRLESLVTVQKAQTRSGRFMPRWASRIMLEVVSVRVERLQEITEEDARAEGIDVETLGALYRLRDGTPVARDAFGDVWAEINGKRAPWASNPWVWRVGFRRMT